MNNVSSHFEGENRAGKKRDARPSGDRKGPFNGESSGFCNITAGTTPQLQRITRRPSAPSERRGSHDEVFRPVRAGAALKSPIRASPSGSDRREASMKIIHEKYSSVHWLEDRSSGCSLRCLQSSNYRDASSRRFFVSGTNDRL